MSLWGKMIGAAAGFAIGGPLGALLGAAAGHAIDRMKEDGPTGAASGGSEAGADPTQSVAFTVAVVVLSAKMAKADGVVKRVEIDTFRRLFRVPDDEIASVGKLFDLARRDVAGFDIYARQVARLFGDRHPVLEELLDSLFLIAEADHVLHPDEVEFLRQVAEIFGFSNAEFGRIFAGRPRTGQAPDGDPWQVLGVARDASPETVKAAYRRLLREHHPDLLIAQGMPKEFIDVATAKTARINAAYAQIKRIQQAE